MPKSSYKQFIGYLIVGCCATAAHFTILICLVSGFGMAPIPASSLGFLIGSTTGFLLNRHFTFKAPASKFAAFLQYCSMAGVGAILNGSILGFLIYKLDLNYLLAQALVTISIVLINFLCCKYWIFKTVNN